MNTADLLLINSVNIPRREYPLFKKMSEQMRSVVHSVIQLDIHPSLLKASWFTEKDPSLKYAKLFEYLEKGYEKCCEMKLENIGMGVLIEKMVLVAVNETTNQQQSVPYSPKFLPGFHDYTANLKDLNMLYAFAVVGENDVSTRRLALLACVLQYTACSEYSCRDGYHWCESLHYFGSLLFLKFLETMELALVSVVKSAMRMEYRSESQVKLRCEKLNVIFEQQRGRLRKGDSQHIAMALRREGVEMTSKQVVNWFVNKRKRDQVAKGKENRSC